MSSFFSEGSPYLEHPLLTAERTASEVDFIIAQLDLPAGASLLDVGCAFGRHSIELAKRGFHVVGIDPAEAMIDAARAAAKAEQVDASFHVADALSYVPEQKFDAALCLFTVLGQISDQGDYPDSMAHNFLNNVTNALKSDGQLLIEIPQREPYRAMLAPQDRFENGQNYTQITRHFDEDPPVLIEQFELGSPAGTREYELRFRLFDQAELTALLTDIGFTNLTWFANYEGKPLGSESPMMLARASR